MNESEFYDMENLTVTMCDMSLEDGDAITNIHVEYWSGNTQMQESYIPAAGGNSTFAIVKGQRGNETVVLDVAFASGTDTSIWSIENQYMRIHAANRGTVTGTTRTATVNVSYRGRDFGTQTITQQANSKNNYVSPGEIDWVRVNNNVLYSGDTISIDNFATTLQLTQVHGYRTAGTTRNSRSGPRPPRRTGRDEGSDRGPDAWDLGFRANIRPAFPPALP